MQSSKLIFLPTCNDRLPSIQFLMALAAQSPAQAKIVTCHGKDIRTPYGQAYRTKNSSLRISDPRFGPACWPSGLSSLVGWYDHCFPAEEVESAHWAAREVSVQKTDCRSVCFNTNGFCIAAEGQLGILESRFEFGIVVQSGYCHVVP